MTADEQQLSYDTVDSLSLAFARNRPIAPRKLTVGPRVGPLIEWLRLANVGRLENPASSNLLNFGRSEKFLSAISNNQILWLQPETEFVGLFRPTSASYVDSQAWYKFSLAGQKAAKAGGFDQPTAARLIAASQELVSNIHEHSGAQETALIAYSSCPNMFEFVVCDCGKGILSTLKSAPEFAELTDEGKALELALTEGVSRFGTKAGRGFGFRPIFTGLSNMGGHLRFKSGDHALTISGGKFQLPLAQISQRISTPGFYASVLCALDGKVFSNGW